MREDMAVYAVGIQDLLAGEDTLHASAASIELAYLADYARQILTRKPQR